MIIVGQKVKKYLFLYCPNCGKYQRVDAEKFKGNENGYYTVECPWCEYNQVVAEKGLNKLPSQFVLDV